MTRTSFLGSAESIRADTFSPQRFDSTKCVHGTFCRQKLHTKGLSIKISKCKHLKSIPARLWNQTWTQYDFCAQRMHLLILLQRSGLFVRHFFSALEIPGQDDGDKRSRLPCCTSSRGVRHNIAGNPCEVWQGLGIKHVSPLYCTPASDYTGTGRGRGLTRLNKHLKQVLWALDYSQS